MKPVAVLYSIAVLAFFQFADSVAADTNAHYKVTREVSVPGDTGWDYLTADAKGHRLFLTHGAQVQVMSTDDFKLLGEIADTPGVHGVALADDLGRGYISAGRSNAVVVFDLKTLARLQEIKTTGDNPDAILYDAFSHQVFTFNGRGRNVTAIDAKTNEVVATIPVDAKPEFAATDLAGHVFVNLEDKSSIAVIDTATRKVQSTWPITGCEDPSGLAIDRAHSRLFAVCSNKLMAVLDAKSGKLITTLPIGGRVDGVAFDAGTGNAFASGGDGTLTVVHEDSPDKFSVTETVQTKVGARTVAVDESSHRVYTMTAKYVAAAPGDTAKPRFSIEPNSFVVLVIER